ncbi:hypothetical protein DNU06_05630 [Putridiphycobacter roseus]|uniref:Uncharacterized protein n=1 Tax=Putridiphycobacter roseus TaxID=2219161 RepID=A0A2W1NJF9_9FLAO|nr:hypothetical protein [Putridiphycobacter roseus]PZE18096.1 hypothetical protein DNU06_05630 [Putridiphycobacter roseus]
MKWKKNVLTVVLVLFGLLTLFLSSSVIFDWFGIRAMEGNYVPIVVWVNFIASVLYLLAAFAIYNGESWMVKPLVLALVMLVVGLIGFWIHVINGGLYETKTIGAMIFRTFFTAFLMLMAFQLKPKRKLP